MKSNPEKKEMKNSLPQAAGRMSIMKVRYVSDSAV